MGLFGGGGKLLTGLDIGASSIKIVVGVRKKKAFYVDRLIIIPLPFKSIDERGISNFDAVSEAVKTAIQELGGKTPGLATALKGGAVITKRVMIGYLPKKEIPDQVKWEAEQVFPQDVSTVMVDHVLIGEGKIPNAPEGENRGWDILLVGAREEEAMMLFDMIESAGASMKYMDLDAFACSDFLEGMVDIPKGEAVAFVDVGASGTRVAVHHLGKIVFIRDSNIGGNAFTDTIATALGLSFENAEALKIQEQSGMPNEAVEAIRGLLVNWKNELQQAEDFFITQSPVSGISKWYIYGGAARTPGLFQCLQDERFGQRAMPLPTSELLLPKGKHVDQGLLNAWSPRLITAAGLSCRKG